VQRRARERETAARTPGRPHAQPVRTGSGAAFDVLQVLLEDVHGNAELVPEIRELPLSGRQQLYDLLTTRRSHRHHSGPQRSNVPTF
jgi:hypothetical protein